MRFIIIVLLSISFSCCKTKAPEKIIEVYYTPGLVEYEYIDTGLLESLKTPDRIYEITLNDYAFMDSIFSNPNTDAAGEAVSPRIFIKYNSILYRIGENRIVEYKDKAFVISEKDDYWIKCLIHFYDFIDKDDLLFLHEIRQFGLPYNYKYRPSDPHKPTKPFIKLILKEVT